MSGGHQRFYIFFKKFLAWFAQVLPLTYRVLPSSAVGRFLWVRACVLRHVMLFPRGFSPPQRPNFFLRLSDLLTQFQVDTGYTWEWRDMKGVVYVRVVWA